MSDRSNPEVLAAREARQQEIATVETEVAGLEAKRADFEATRVEALRQGRLVCADLDAKRQRLDGLKRSLGEPA